MAPAHRLVLGALLAAPLLVAACSDDGVGARCEETKECKFGLICDRFDNRCRRPKDVKGTDAAPLDVAPDRINRDLREASVPGPEAGTGEPPREAPPVTPEPGQDGGMDGGPDSGTADAGADAAPEAGAPDGVPEAGTEAGAADAEGDAADDAPPVTIDAPEADAPEADAAEDMAP